MTDSPEKVRKKPGAKPLDWGPEILAKIEQLASIGLYQHEIVQDLGRSAAAWYMAIADGKVEILEAYQRGWAKHRALVFGGLAKNAAKGDREAQKFLAKAHFKRQETFTVTLAGDPDNPLTVDHTHAKLTPEERKERLKALDAKRKALTE